MIAKISMNTTTVLLGSGRALVMFGRDGRVDERVEEDRRDEERQHDRAARPLLGTRVR